MAELYFSLSLGSVNSMHRLFDSKSISHRLIPGKKVKTKNSRCKSQEKLLFEHNKFTHGKVIKATHDIPHESTLNHEHKHHEDHSRTVTIKKRVVSENILLDSFPPHV